MDGAFVRDFFRLDDESFATRPVKLALHLFDVSIMRTETKWNEYLYARFALSDLPEDPSIYFEFFHRDALLKPSRFDSGLLRDPKQGAHNKNAIKYERPSRKSKPYAKLVCFSYLSVQYAPRNWPANRDGVQLVSRHSSILYYVTFCVINYWIHFLQRRTTIYNIGNGQDATQITIYHRVLRKN